MCELFFFHVSSFLLMWLYYKFIVALVVNIILISFLVLFVKNGYDIIKELYVDESEAITGKFNTLKENFGDFDKKTKDGKNAYYKFKDE